MLVSDYSLVGLRGPRKKGHSDSLVPSGIMSKEQTSSHSVLMWQTAEAWAGGAPGREPPGVHRRGRGPPLPLSPHPPSKNSCRAAQAHVYFSLMQSPRWLPHQPAALLHATTQRPSLLLWRGSAILNGGFQGRPTSPHQASENGNTHRRMEEEGFIGPDRK